MNRQRGS